MQMQSYRQIADNFLVAVETKLAGRLDFTVLSTTRLIFEATAHGLATLAMWIQAVILQGVARSRAATSSGDDLTSWMADFGFDRLDGESDADCRARFKAAMAMLFRAANS